jgi:chromosome segregation ATPase
MAELTINLYDDARLSAILNNEEYLEKRESRTSELTEHSLIELDERRSTIKYQPDIKPRIHTAVLESLELSMHSAPVSERQSHATNIYSSDSDEDTASYAMASRAHNVYDCLTDMVEDITLNNKILTNNVSNIRKELNEINTEIPHNLLRISTMEATLDSVVNELRMLNINVANLRDDIKEAKKQVNSSIMTEEIRNEIRSEVKNYLRGIPSIEQKFSELANEQRSTLARYLRMMKQPS